MHQTLTQFYEAFSSLDAEMMASCYHPQVRFEDPAFGILEGSHASNMWRMLCASQKNKDFKLTFDNVRADDHSGSAHWEARYTFSKTGRKVHNIIEASFTFRDGLIYTHKDDFDLHRWATQAMGLQGWLLGSTGFFRRKLQHQTNHLLNQFESTR